MKTVYQKNELLQGESKFCPGCGHGIVNKLIAEVLSENGWAGKAIECLCIGCAINMTEYVNWDILACPHGRAAAVATGVSRVNKDAVVFTYQGDGDAGGIGLAPLHAAINYCRHYRDRYGKIDIVYGSRSKEDLGDFPEIENVWCREDGINVHLTIDREQPEWDGHVGFVPNYVKELGFTTDKTVVMCGPPIMIKFTLAGLMELGFAREQVYTTMELKMKCGLGKCGRCNIGDKYVCKDGPVFRFDQLDELPNEY